MPLMRKICHFGGFGEESICILGEKYVFLMYFRGKVGDLRWFLGGKYVVWGGFKVEMRWSGVGILRKPCGILMVSWC